ncbi:MAG: cupin domain-containing protein [Syntrophomonadaceae bacterium]
MQYFRKNIDYAKILDLKSLVPYVEGKVVSQALVQTDLLNMTVFAIDKGEELNFQSASGEAMIYVIDGKMEAKIWGEEYYLHEGEAIVVPANISYQFTAVERLMVLSTIVNP